MFIFGPDNPWVTYKLSTFAIMFFFKGKESYDWILLAGLRMNLYIPLF